MIYNSVYNIIDLIYNYLLKKTNLINNDSALRFLKVLYSLDLESHKMEYKINKTLK